MSYLLLFTIYGIPTKELANRKKVNKSFSVILHIPIYISIFCTALEPNLFSNETKFILIMLFVAKLH